MIPSTVPGYPRIGRNRELKKAIEAYWQGKSSAEDLSAEAARLRREHLQSMLDSGLQWIPVGDFSLYDGMLDTAVLLGWIPERYRAAGESDLDTYFAMARGKQEVPPLEMTKWFDTNYHYIRPELSGPPALVPESEDRLLRLYREARATVGARAKPVLPGPYTFLRLSRLADSASLAGRLEELGGIYGELLDRLGRAGAEWVQLDEPALVLSGPIDSEAALVRAYDTMTRSASGGSGPKVLLQTYFGPIWGRRDLLRKLPVSGIGIDLVRGAENWRFLDEGADQRVCVAGVLDGRNVWRSDLEGLLERLGPAAARMGDRLWVGASSSLQFLPYSVEAEPQLDPEVRSWIAFAQERLHELEILRKALSEGAEAVRPALDEATRALGERAASVRTRDPEVRRKIDRLEEGHFRRPPFAERRPLQERRFRLPLLPTTTIGSFPQTPEVRRNRGRFKSGKMDQEAYQEFIRGEIEHVIRLQEEVGLDVLVHGEFERSDMVDYFGEQLNGMAVTENGWVQSYGTRCVRPPVIYGDVSRQGAMTVRESRMAQLMTRRPVKGMLTGPVTILNWSFPREDLPRPEVAYQIALALREEAGDLENAGIGMVQMDEPAFREGLPLSEEARNDYLTWAVRAFRLASSGVKPETQIHTHMCYSDFNEIISWIAELDADVLSIENSRSSGELLRAFQDFRYSAWIGPGVYDIHSPRVPSEDEIVGLIRRTLEVLPPGLVWINPDCGLKTRGYEEAVPALKNLVAAALHVRKDLS